jgi:hypothetical protein
MRYTLPLIAVLALACEERGSLTGDDSDAVGGADTDAGGDTGASDTGDEDTGGGTQPNAPALDLDAWHHVLSDARLLPSGQGVDIDGDGTPDNALGGIAGQLNNLGGGGGITDAIAGGGTFVIFQSWGVRDCDDAVRVGLLQAADSDTDPDDNFTTKETYLVSEGLGADGKAALGTDTTLDSAGGYRAEIEGFPLDLGFLQIPVSSPWVIEATVTEGKHEGRIGTAIAVQEIIDLINDNGLGFVLNFFDPRDLADVDLDDDDSNESISLVLGFEAVPCGINRP